MLKPSIDAHLMKDVVAVQFANAIAFLNGHQADAAIIDVDLANFG